MSLILSVAVVGGCYGDSASSSSKESKPARSGTLSQGSKPARSRALNPPADAKFLRKTRDILEYELSPSYSGRYEGSRFTTNRRGMRDKEYDEHRPPSTYRIALLGSGYAMAAGLDEPDSFQAVLEDELNAESHKNRSAERYEILNFGVAGYSALQNLAVLERKVWQFQPNAILVVLEPNELKLLGNSLIRIARDTIDVPYPRLKEVLQKAKVAPGISELDAAAKLRPSLEGIDLWSLKQIVEGCRNKGVVCLATVIPRAGRGGKDADVVLDVSSRVEEAGFTVLHVDDVFEGHAADSLKAGSGLRANPLAQRLIAGALLSQLQKTAGDRFHLAPKSGGPAGGKKESTAR